MAVRSVNKNQERFGVLLESIKPKPLNLAIGVFKLIAA